MELGEEEHEKIDSTEERMLEETEERRLVVWTKVESAEMAA